MRGAPKRGARSEANAPAQGATRKRYRSCAVGSSTPPPPAVFSRLRNPRLLRHPIGLSPVALSGGEAGPSPPASDACHRIRPVALARLSPVAWSERQARYYCSSASLVTNTTALPRDPRPFFASARLHHRPRLSIPMARSGSALIPGRPARNHAVRFNDPEGLQRMRGTPE